MSDSKIGSTSIPVDDLALLYLERCGGLSTPADFVDAFIQAHDAIIKRVDELKPKAKISMPPNPPLRKSPWRD